MEYVLQIDFEVRYHLQRPVQINDVIDSLTSLAKILPTTLPTLRYYDKINAPKRVECFVKSIEEGSLVDLLITHFFFDSEDGAKAWMKAVKDKTGLTFMERKLPILSPIIKGIIVLGGLYYIKQIVATGHPTESDHSNTIVLEDQARAIIQIGSNSLSIPEDEFKKLTETAVQKQGVAKAACTFVRPAKTSSTPVAITLDGGSFGQEISETCVAAIPDVRELNVLETCTQYLNNTEIQIRSCDMDHADRGWNAIVPAVANKRLPLSLDPTINREQLMPRQYQGDITLEYTVDNEGNRKYKKVTLRNLSPSAPSAPPSP